MLLSFDSTVLRLFYLCSSLIKPLSASDQQHPLISHSENEQVLPSSASRWNFNFSSSAPHYFASVYGLLQQSSNTFFPNGHSIAPCEIPPFTKLYHGRRDGKLPPSPEWISFDIEMAYGIMGSTRNSHMLTYQTTRPMKCIYFDGESATLMGTGQMDTQMLQLYGNVSGPVQDGRGFRGLYDEYARATGLCDWLRDKKLGGPGWGYEGIVRMNAGFEMIVCNFSSPSLRLVSHLNITAPLLAEDDNGDKDKFVQAVGDVDLARRADMTSYFPLPPSQTNTDRVTNPTDPPGPPNWRRGTGGEPFLRSQAWGWFTSASTHYGSSALGAGLGEIRVKPLSCGVLNYYSPIFRTQAIARAENEQKSLNLTTSGLWTGPGSNGTRAEGLIHLTRRRRAHTLDAVTTTEASIMKANSERVLRDLLSSSPNCSGIDWAVMTNEIVQRNAGDLAEFLMVLQKYYQIPVMVIKNQTAIREWIVEVRELTHSFLLPFLEYPASRGEEVTSDTWARGSRLFNDTHARCQFHHTRLLDPQEGLLLSPEENTLKWAVEETHGGICDVLVDVGLSVEGIWESKFSVPVKDSEVVENKGMKTEIERWIEGVEELMAWLGWAGEWVGCEKRCAYDEKCFIPMWPMLARRNPGFGRGPPPGEGGDRPGRDGPDSEDEPGEGRPGEGRPGEDGPGHGRPGKGGPGGPGRGRPGRGGGPGWNQDDTELWQPTCVKIDHIMG